MNTKGQIQTACLGRNKSERRPMILIEAEAEGQPISVFLQNAETIHLTDPQGRSRLEREPEARGQDPRLYQEKRPSFRREGRRQLDRTSRTLKEIPRTDVP